MGSLSQNTELAYLITKNTKPSAPCTQLRVNTDLETEFIYAVKHLRKFSYCSRSLFSCYSHILAPLVNICDKMTVISGTHTTSHTNKNREITNDRKYDSSCLLTSLLVGDFQNYRHLIYVTECTKLSTESYR